jgi:HSP20 family molecular chaperone IbpA
MSTMPNTSHQDVLEATRETERTMRPQQVPVNMYEASGALVIIAPTPAVTPADVTVELRGSKLRLCALLRSAGTREYLLHEWEYGGYERELDLPAGYGSDVEVALNNGQLVIRVKAGEPRDLTVQPS